MGTANDAEKKVKTVIDFLNYILQDKIPRNIKEGIENAIKCLEDKNKDLSVRIVEAIEHLEMVTNDPNIPMYTRTQILNVIATLEMISKEVSK